ncbi:hypothetical protein Xen7305DRAFT_00003180 [Xenococcus sp. PCC 7305]|uniref:hypothetical protein n=1 Tax=Xenococcus sp. PCC 7305 TaxID=102125 RepID=UPI0002AC5C57|nr:hypothetical protein [Xenococcus sp. PCC 7305]ELS00617.1 hypothetical protein Xen7305DRAFT_00003180 [Xenococcus sp. PCC 7305]
MKAGEIIRIIIFTVLGLILMFWLQPLIYTERYIRISDYSINGSPVGVETWVANNYMVGAGIVFGFSLFATLCWYFSTGRAKVKDASDVARWNIVWWLLGLLPIIGIVIALIFFTNSDDALLSLTGLFIFNGLFLLYWLPTATSSPGSFKYTPPGAMLVRRLIGS